MQSTDFDGSFQGLSLPRAVIDRIYRDNARKLWPQAWPAAPTGH